MNRRVNRALNARLPINQRGDSHVLFQRLLRTAMIVSTAASVATASTRGQTLGESALTCSNDLRLLRARIEQNYAGYRLEVKGAKQQRFEKEYSLLSARAARAEGTECYFVLKRLIAWFDDPHLFLFETSRLDTAETTRRARTVAMMAIDESMARAYFASHSRDLDPVEGIWYDGPLRFAVVPDPISAKGSFVAVLLNGDSTIWRPGAIRARFVRRAAGRYDVELWERNFALHHRDAAIYKHVLLRLSPGIWGKEFSIARADSGLLDPADAHRPTLIARNGIVIVSIPSHDGPNKGVLDSLIQLPLRDLRNAEYLIVDLRGNEGGGSGMSESLMPYIASEHQRPGLLEQSNAVILSSDDQIAYARRAFGSDTSRFVRSLLQRMRAHPGSFVPLSDPGDAPEPPAKDSVIVGPRRVGVLIDGGTVSASEVLVLRALRSERVIVFGEPTAGALDYQSTNIVAFSPNERRWFLGYPTITRNIELPTGGMRGRGIAPTVRLDLSRLRDPLEYIEHELKKAPIR
ncbi:MAG TPA: S41 family peptidase [Gemmatimonadaceae bacterium]|nr:S41 family peptidase [Gemmatimonadaceae bacterium]